MIVLPAIDLLGGQPVRLRQGDFEQVTRFADDAVTLARRLEAGGAEWLHLVDLEGARSGRWRNLEVIAQVVAAVSVPVQAGGGARQMRDVEAALELGVARVVVGTTAVASPTGFDAFVRRYGDRVAVSLDVRGDRLAVEGWSAESRDSLLSVAEQLKAAGVRRFIHTNVGRDGTLAGVDLEGLARLLPLGLPVVVAGGIAGADDVRALRDAGAEGAIIGRALLDGTLDLSDALRVASGGHASGRTAG
jgi:phosphoribosylformimino-5-aminoimidazole carboxamide ribotide isomerase